MVTATQSTGARVRRNGDQVEQRVLLPRISWSTYQVIAEGRHDAAVPRLAYLDGALELMSPSFRHENLSRLAEKFVTAVALGLGRPLKSAGSTRWEQAGLNRGKEPDCSFYLDAHAQAIRGRRDIDLDRDGPPDLVVEVEITSPLLDALTIYARLGVPELWRHDGQTLSILHLAGDAYVARENSRAFPSLRSLEVQTYLAEGEAADETTWFARVLTFARDELAHRVS